MSLFFCVGFSSCTGVYFYYVFISNSVIFHLSADTFAQFRKREYKFLSLNISTHTEKNTMSDVFIFSFVRILFCIFIILKILSYFTKISKKDFQFPKSNNFFLYKLNENIFSVHSVFSSQSHTRTQIFNTRRDIETK